MLTCKKKISIYILGIIMVSVIFAILFKPNTSEEHVIEEFRNNKKYFNDIKDYMLSQDSSYFLSEKSNEFESANNELLRLKRKLFGSLKYEWIENSYSKKSDSITIKFSHKTKRGEEYGLIYSGREGDSTYGMYSVDLGEGWYYYWIGFDMH